MVDDAVHIGADYIEVGLDLGTSTAKVNGAYRLSGNRVTQPEILLLQNKRVIPTALAYYDKKFYWGQDLLDRVDLGTIPAENVIRHHKLASYESFDKPGISEAKDQVIAQLADAGVSLEQMSADLIAHIMLAIRESICRTQNIHNRSRDAIFHAPMKGRFAVPQSFSPAAARKLRVAAEKAGFSTIEIVPEQISALRAYLANSRDASLFSEGDGFILVDAGCGTVDCVLYQHHGGHGVDSLFAAIAQSFGSVFGSQQVNVRVKKRAVANHGGMASICQQLGMQPAAVDYQLETGVEAAKHNFNHKLPGDRLLSQINITNYNLPTEERRSINFQITQQMIRDALDAVIEENFKDVDYLLEKHAEITQKAIDDAKARNCPDLVDKLEKKRKLQYIILSGGGAQCPYMTVKYEERYGKMGITIVLVAGQMGGEALHVAMGLLAPRDSLITNSKLPFRYTYAVVRDEPFLPKTLHFDCCKPDKNGRLMPIKKKVRCQVNGTGRNGRIVLSRLNFILQRGRLPEDMTPVDIIFYPFVDDPVIFVEMVCTQGYHENHGPALVDDHDITSHDNKLREGVIPWQDPSWLLDTELLRRGGWKTIPDSETGRLRYDKVWGRISFRGKEEESISLKLEIVLPNKATGLTDLDGKGETVEFEGVKELWDPQKNEFVSDADAGEGGLVEKGGAGDLLTEAGVAADRSGIVDADGDTHME